MPETRPWHRDAVLYQIYARSFADANGDGVGDLPGVIGKLDYVAELGVDGIWLSPFFKSPMKDFGYDVADYRAVDPLFGTNEDFDRLLEGAHARGLKLVIDMVACHSSDQHAWFVESRRSRDNAKADWYVWADPRADGTEPNNWLSIFGGRAWTWEPRRRQYYLHHFLSEQPNLNYHNAEVVEAVLADCRFWLDKGVDGFRMDAIHTLAHDPQLRDNPVRAAAANGTGAGGARARMPAAMQDQTARQFQQPRAIEVLRALRALVDAYPERYLLGEVGGPTSLRTSGEYTAGDDLMHATYNFSLLATDPMTPAQIRSVLRQSVDTIEDDKVLFATSNHDVARVASRLLADDLSDAQRDDLACAVIALETCLHGAACIYQGEELALVEAKVPFARMRDPFSIRFHPDYQGRDGCRTPMPWTADAANAGFSETEPWLPVDPRHAARAVDRQLAAPASALNRTRRFLRWRKAQPAFRSSPITLLEDKPEALIAFTRGAGAARTLCLFNFTGAARDYPAPGGAAALNDSGFIAELTAGAVRVAPYSAAFVSLAGA